jgi:hypothetical protein
LMIHINFTIENPFKGSNFTDIWAKAIRVTKNKTLELQIYRYGVNVFELGLRLTFSGSDHAGPSFELGIFGWYFTISLPDNRHWDYENNCWEKATPN